MTTNKKSVVKLESFQFSVWDTPSHVKYLPILCLSKLDWIQSRILRVFGQNIIDNTFPIFHVHEIDSIRASHSSDQKCVIKIWKMKIHLFDDVCCWQKCTQLIPNTVDTNLRDWVRVWWKHEKAAMECVSMSAVFVDADAVHLLDIYLLYIKSFNFMNHDGMRSCVLVEHHKHLNVFALAIFSLVFFFFAFAGIFQSSRILCVRAAGTFWLERRGLSAYGKCKIKFCWWN